MNFFERPEYGYGIGEVLPAGYECSITPLGDNGDAKVFVGYGDGTVVDYEAAVISGVALMAAGKGGDGEITRLIRPIVADCVAKIEERQNPAAKDTAHV